jgi:hypothetical protein
LFGTACRISANPICGLDAGFDAEFLENPVIVIFHGLQRDEQGIGDFLIALALTDQLENFALSLCHTISLDGVLGAATVSNILLDLSATPQRGLVHDWMHGKQLHRTQGGYATLRPARAFDAIIFTDSISKTRFSSAARKRFETMR